MLGDTRLAHGLYALFLAVFAFAAGVLILGHDAAQGTRLAASAVGFVAALLAGAVDPHAPEARGVSLRIAHAPPDAGKAVRDSTARPAPVNRRRSPR